jgi:lipopolysaccharide export system protein LptA
MIVRLLTSCIMIIAFSLSIPSAKATMSLRIAVLPFEVYSDESTEYLRNTISKELSSQMAAERQIEIVDPAEIKHVLDSEAPLNFDEVILKRIAEKLKAHFLVLGSLTRISDNLSMDIYVFNPQGPPPFSKDFTEGNELNSLIRKMVRKINAKVLLLARNYPELQEPEPVEKAELKIPEEEISPADAQPYPSDSVQVEKEEEKQVVPEGQVREETLFAQTEAGEEETEAREEETEVGEEEMEAGKGEAEKTAVAMLPETSPGELTEKPKDIPKKDRKKKSASAPFSSERPIKITSNNLEADNKRNMVTFKGNVVAKQEDMVIFSDLMKVRYAPKGGGIKTVEAMGGVKMTQEDMIATGQKIVFYNSEQKIVMTGNPRIWQDDNLISCDKVTVLLKEDKIFFEGDVDTTIYPDSMKENDQENAKQIEEVALPVTQKAGNKTTDKKESPEGIQSAEIGLAPRAAHAAEPQMEKDAAATGEKLALKKNKSSENIQSAEKEAVQKFVSDWKHYWESKDLENYMRCYSKEFTSRGMNWDRWKSYKQQFNEKYQQISLAFNDMQIALEGDHATVRFEQYYQSDDYSDHGMKSLILKKENGSWNIFAERWDPL